MARVFIGYFVLALLLVALAYHAVFACRGVRTFDLVSLEDFKTYYRSNGYSLESLLNGDLKEVPRVFINRIPKVWSEDSLSPENRKNIFFLFCTFIV